MPEVSANAQAIPEFPQVPKKLLGTYLMTDFRNFLRHKRTIFSNIKQSKGIFQDSRYLQFSE
jgi:hypothetical protein